MAAIGSWTFCHGVNGYAGSHPARPSNLNVKAVKPAPPIIPVTTTGPDFNIFTGLAGSMVNGGRLPARAMAASGHARRHRLPGSALCGRDRDRGRGAGPDLVPPPRRRVTPAQGGAPRQRGLVRRNVRRHPLRHGIVTEWRRPGTGLRKPPRAARRARPARATPNSIRGNRSRSIRWR